MGRTALIALFLIAGWPALGSARDVVKYEARKAAEPHVTRRVIKRSVAAGLLILGIAY
jgi:hypothetical protein